MRFIPQKSSLVFITYFFLALRENKEKSKYSKNNSDEEDDDVDDDNSNDMRSN